MNSPQQHNTTSNMADDGDVNWNVDLEVSLFHAMRRHKPVGVNRHFQMVFIHDKLNNCIAKKVSAKSIWTHLTEMYDLAALNESEILPFPNKDIEFRLPDPDYRELMDREYPRAPRPSQRHQEDRPPPLEEHHHSAPAQSSHHHVHGKGKGREKEHKHEHKEKEHKEHHHKEKESSGTPAHLSRSHDAEDSPKREARKRTRQSLADSPATRERDTPSAKRARRTQ